MDDYPHCRVVHAAKTEFADAPVSAPTYVRIHDDKDVLIVGAPGLAVATSTLNSGAKVLQIIVYALALEGEPEDESIGMAHSMTVEQARGIASSINDMCDRAEQAAMTLASVALAKARAR